MKDRKKVRGLTSLAAREHSAGPGSSMGKLKTGPEPLPPGAGTERYREDQDRQARRKKAVQEAPSRALARRAAQTVRASYVEADRILEETWDATLSFRLDPNDSALLGDPEVVPEQTVEWHNKAIRDAELCREKRWVKRPGKDDRYYQRPIERSWTTRKKRGDKEVEVQVRAGSRRIEVAFSAGPVVSRGLLYASQAGQAAVARRFAKEWAVCLTRLLPKLTGGARLITAPLHVKADNMHLQPSWSLWSDPVPAPGAVVREGKELPTACLPVGGVPGIKNRMQKWFSMSVAGALRQARIGLDVDALTGRSDAVADGLDLLAKASRHQTPLNYLVMRWSDLWVHCALKRPEYAPLTQFVEQSKEEYFRRKQEQLALIEKEAEATTGARANREAEEARQQAQEAVRRAEVADEARKFALEEAEKARRDAAEAAQKAEIAAQTSSVARAEAEKARQEAASAGRKMHIATQFGAKAMAEADQQVAVLGHAMQLLDEDSLIAIETALRCAQKRKVPNAQSLRWLVVVRLRDDSYSHGLNDRALMVLKAVANFGQGSAKVKAKEILEEDRVMRLHSWGAGEKTVPLGMGNPRAKAGNGLKGHDLD